MVQVVDQTWICVVNVVTTVGKLSIKRIQQKVSYRWISRKTKKECLIFFSYTLFQPISLISFINLALNGEKIRPKKKDLPPNSSSKSRQGQGRKKVTFNFNFISIFYPYFEWFWLKYLISYLPNYLGGKCIINIKIRSTKWTMRNDLLNGDIWSCIFYYVFNK